ncbi:CHASE2 domain-containing protein [Coleofasciculus sp.]|uniref:CHASE2 domain-containing protein n=1 Tax=Coleofasciculus sp. TaxID=3100458 RepID=UPI003A271DF4
MILSIWRIILIGATGQIANDLYLTPYSQNTIGSPEQTPGVIIHANIASQILSGAIAGRPFIKVLTDPVEWLWMFLWGVINGSLGLWFGRLRSQQWLFVAIASIQPRLDTTHSLAVSA